MNHDQSLLMRITNPLVARLYSLLRYRRVPPFPHSFVLETTSRCNLHCRMCPRGRMQRPARDMDPALFRSLIDQMVAADADRHLRFLALHWFGEPLLHPQLLELIAYAGERLPGLREYGREADAMRGLCLSTNATLLEGQLAAGLLASRLTWLGVSVDGNSRETYRSLRGEGQFEKVVANVEELLRLNTATPRTLPTVAIQMIATTATRPEFADLREHWLAVAAGAPNVRIELKPYTDWAGQVEEPQLCPPDRRGAFWDLNCGRLWDTLVVGAGGEIGLCCYDMEAAHRLGNAGEAPLAQLWRSRRLAALRRAHADGRLAKLPLCGHCLMGRKFPQEYLRRRGRS